MKSRSFALVVSCYAIIYIVWGSTYYAIKLAVDGIAPFWVVGLRFFIGGIIFLIIVVALGRMPRLPKGKELLSALFQASFLLLGGNALVTIAEKKVDSYLAALIVTSTPLGVAIFNSVLFKIRLSRVSFAGVAAGIGGAALLLYNGKSVSSSLSPSVLLVILAMLLWSFATCISKRLTHYPDIFASSGIQMAMAGAIALAIALLMHRTGLQEIRLTASNIGGVAYLAIIGSGAFAAYNYLLVHEPAQRISSYALVNPAVAVALGLLLGHEKATPLLFVGFPFVMTGIFLLLYGDKFMTKRPDRIN